MDGRNAPLWRSVSLKVAGAYLVIGVLWILFSDRLILLAAPDVGTLTILQHYKGLFFILATALLLRALIERHLRALRDVDRKAEEAKEEFYRSTIFAVSGGKLNLVCCEDILPFVGDDPLRLPFDAAGMAEVRRAARKAALGAGLGETDSAMFELAVGEACTNAVKYAGGGVALLAADNASVRVCVQDSGRGSRPPCFRRPPW